MSSSSSSATSHEASSLSEEGALKFSQAVIGRPKEVSKGCILFIVNETRFFVSHRLALALGALRDGYDVHLAGFANGGEECIRRHGIHLHPLPIDSTGLNPASDLCFIVRLASIIRHVRPDLTHCVTIKPVMYGGLLSRLLGVGGCVTALSGLGQLFQSQSLKIRLARSVAKPICRLAMAHRNGHSVFQNQHDLDEFVAAGLVKTDRVTLVRGSGVDPTIYRAEPEPKGTPTITLPARMLWSKGIGDFVDAAQALRAGNIDVNFVLAGTPPKDNRDAVPEAQLRAWHNEKLVTWLGHCDDMPALFARSMIVCLPTFYREGVPKALIEAAACGRPIITTDMPGCNDICQHELNGLLISPRNSPALVDAIKQLLDSPELRQRMGKKGRELVERDFHVDQVVSETLAIYRSLLTTATAPSGTMTAQS